MRAIHMVTLLLAGAAALPAQAEHWTKIDFDADLRTMLVDTDSIQHANGHATLTELQVEGRTAPTRGDQFHVLVGRDFDCTTGTSVVTSVQTFADLKSPGVSLAVPVVSFVPSPGQITYVEQGIACKGNAPPAGTNIYTSITEAVDHAFADAVKLPADQSNRTNHGMAGMGPPPKAR